MSKRKVNRGRDYWEKQVKAWRRSGRTQREYCKSKKLSLFSLQSWSRKFPEKSSKEPVTKRRSSATFMPLNITSTTGSHDFSLELTNGRKLSFSATIETSKITEVIQALETC